MTLFDNIVAQFSHFGWAALIVTWAGILAPGHIVSILVVGELLAAVKEFWFDIRYESSDESGGYVGSLLDFVMYTLGAGSAVFVLYARGMI